MQSQTRSSGCSTVGSAPRSGRGGRKFESSHPDKQDNLSDHLACKVVIVFITKLLGSLMKLIEHNIESIIELCKRFHVRRLWVFGSILTDRFNDNSDVDLCVDFDWKNIPLMDAADNFFDFQYALEDIFGRKVDITDDSAVRNKHFRQELNETRRLIYGGENLA